MWNALLSYEIAKEIKNLDSAVPVVFGGLNYPIDPHRQSEWLEHHSADYCPSAVPMKSQNWGESLSKGKIRLVVVGR